MGNDKSLKKSYSYKQKTLMFVVILFVSSCSSAAINNNNNNNNNSNETFPSQQMVTLSNVTLFVNSPTTEYVCDSICKCTSTRSFDDYGYDDKHKVSCQMPDTLKEIPLMPRWNVTVHVTELYVFSCITFIILSSCIVSYCIYSGKNGDFPDVIKVRLSHSFQK